MNYPSIELYITSRIYLTGAYANRTFMFAWSSRDHRQIGGLNTCKAYLQDDLHFRMQGRASVFYGYTEFIDMDKTRICIINLTLNNQHIPVLLDYLWQIEDAMKFERTQINIATKLTGSGICDNPEFLAIEVVGDKRWMTAIPMLSFYTLLIRTSTAHEIGKPWEKTIENIISGSVPIPNSADRQYMTQGYSAILNIVKYGPFIYFFPEIEKNYPLNASNSHGCGIGNFGQNYSIEFCSLWKERAEIELAHLQ